MTLTLLHNIYGCLQSHTMANSESHSQNHNFQTMGSTSSIATAVNSKIIKAMPFVLPTKKEINNFHRIMNPIFNQIKANQKESRKLAQLRDVLLPKLMSGEIDVSNVNIDDLASADKLSFTKE